MNDTTYNGEPYATYLMVTDTQAYDVIGSTAKTITVRKRRQTDRNRRDMMVDQGPLPVVWTETESDPTAEPKRLRLRKDGTYRIADWAYPLHFKNDPPEERTDYRF